jgi:CPA1 family monovalent cation:H+ antiporter
LLVEPLHPTPLLLLADLGVLAATLITGYAVHWVFGLPVIIALLFGSIISATDPISVLSIFQDLNPTLPYRNEQAR